MSNLYSLDKLLSSLKEDGLVNIELMKFGKNITEISLTDKGYRVAEQLLNAELAAKGSLKKSFFSRQQLIIMLLGDRRKLTVGQIKEEIPGSYDDLKELEGMKLARSEIDNTAHPPQNWMMLTEKGERAFDKIRRLEEEIKG